MNSFVFVTFIIQHLWTVSGFLPQYLPAVVQHHSPQTSIISCRSTTNENIIPAATGLTDDQVCGVFCFVWLVGWLVSGLLD